MPLQTIETGCVAESESALLRDLLARNLGRADPLEVQTYSDPLASLTAYRHRLQALRRDYVEVRLRVIDLEAQLTQTRQTLETMRSSQGWKWVERYRRWRETLSRWFHSTACQ